MARRLEGAASVGAASALRSVLQRVYRVTESCGRLPEEVRVVAVGKTKPVSLIRQLYDAGHRCFGENYVQEIVEKAPQLFDSSSMKDHVEFVVHHVLWSAWGVLRSLLED